MKPITEIRWDDLALAVLLLLIGIPRALLAALYDRPQGAEGTLAIVCGVLALLVVVGLRRS